jgi:hypothetical protein
MFVPKVSCPEQVEFFLEQFDEPLTALQFGTS